MKLVHLLPFMDNEELKELAYKILNKEVKGVRLVTLYPFLDREDLEEIFEKVLVDGDRKLIYSALPFLSKKSLNKLYEDVKAGKVEGFKESALLPFLGNDKIKEMFYDLVKKAETEDIVDIDDDDDEDDE